MNEQLFRQNLPHVFRLEYEIQLPDGTWETRWVIVTALDFKEAWRSFARRLTPEGYRHYQEGRIRLRHGSTGLQLDAEYRRPPAFDMPVEGLPQTYYKLHAN